MQHIKDYWKESEVFHASNLNEIARTINKLIDASEISVIDDERISSGSTYSSAKIVEMIEGAGFRVAVVDELPVVGEHSTIYFVPSLDPKEKDATDEFIWCDGRWEQIGSTRVDFSNYYTKGEIDDTVDVIEGMIADKADVNHTHSIDEIDNLESRLAEKSNTGHTHGMSEVSGLNNALAGKSDTGHTHQMNDVSGLSNALAGKSDTGHTHEISGVNGLQNALAGKSDTGHTHSEYSLTSHTHSEYSQTGHTHNIGEIDNLENTLAGKSDTGHTHSEYSPTGHTHSQYSLTSHTHTAAEVGALPDTTVVPTKTSQLTNDSGFLTEHQQLKTVNGESLVGTGNVTIIDDTQASLQKTYSSSKIDGMLAAPSVQEVLDVLNEPEPYDDGYEHGSTDSYSGETQNPHSAGTYSYTEWNNGYEDGWEHTHPEPQIEMHYWFVYSGDADTNGVVIDRDMFTEMITGTSSLNSSFVVEGVTYTTTKRSSDAATFGNIVIPSGKTATVYLAAVSSGSAARKVLLTNDATGYYGELNIDGGSSSLRVGTLTDVPGGLTYKLSRNGNENVRVSALIVKLQ